ncbi:hypothetical protein DFH06DRAFT_725076 [Mycena polygramma]|nr:hypothetical protein DFH06DRAFT_725076 [Mycena polygramma]
MDPGTTLFGMFLLAALYLGLRPRSTIRNIPGPPSPSWIYGNSLQLMLPSRYGDNEFTWLKLYGPTYRLRGCFGASWPHRTDLTIQLFRRRSVLWFQIRLLCSIFSTAHASSMVRLWITP